jgi:hypothetical protein
MYPAGPPIHMPPHIPPPQIFHNFSPAPQPLPSAVANSTSIRYPITVNPPYNPSLLSILNNRSSQPPIVPAPFHQWILETFPLKTRHWSRCQAPSFLRSTPSILNSHSFTIRLSLRLIFPISCSSNCIVTQTLCNSLLSNRWYLRVLESDAWAEPVNVLNLDASQSWRQSSAPLDHGKSSHIRFWTTANIKSDVRTARVVYSHLLKVLGPSILFQVFQGISPDLSCI